MATPVVFISEARSQRRRCPVDVEMSAKKSLRGPFSEIQNDGGPK